MIDSEADRNINDNDEEFVIDENIDSDAADKELVEARQKKGLTLRRT